jgi:hypothetical protein
MQFRSARTHRVFLIWLLYATLVVFATMAAAATGLPGIVLQYDHSYLSVVMVVLFVIAEVFAGRSAWIISEEDRRVSDIEEWIRGQTATLVPSPTGVTMRRDDGQTMTPSGISQEHLMSIQKMAETGKSFDQRFIMELTTERLHRKASVTEFISGRIVWVGIFATVMGVILSFWPFMTTGANIEQIQGRLGEFFSGVAVAFIPTAISFVLKIFLDVSDRILRDGIDDVTERLAYVTETRIRVLDRVDA